MSIVRVEVEPRATRCQAGIVGVAMLLLVHLGACCALWGAQARGPVAVRLQQTDGGWQLIRDGKPYFVKGAGGSASKRLLAEYGGNSFRTWGTDGLDEQLEEAQRLGLTVTVGIWLGHEQHGFDYTNAEHVARQQEEAREVILRYKDHPALLIWGLGNEMEGPGKGDNAAIWSAVNNIASMAKKLDPNHPTMTVVAEIAGDRVKSIHRLCPDVDIVGINSYAGLSSIPKRYRDAGGTKPYIITEFGPPGAWEIPLHSWGAAPELSSTAKAEWYRKGYLEAVEAEKGRLCLGSYAFTWGSKHETTFTWFGMFLRDGTRLGAVDVMAELWSGKPPANRCPRIESVKLAGSNEVEPRDTVRCSLKVSDPENDALRIKWALHRDVEKPGVAVAEGEAQPDDARIEVAMPKDGGTYRLYIYVYDGKGGGATASVALRVKGPEPAAPAARLPLVLYADGPPVAAYTPSGWMGNVGAISMDQRCRTLPHTGQTCLKVDYRLGVAWGGVAWQDPVNDWGDKPGGWNLTGARVLSFWARGETGGEKVKFGFGLLGLDKPFHDTAQAAIEATLTKEWKSYTLDLNGKDLRRIKTGFFWTVAGQGKPVTFYLDDIRYE